MRTAAVLLVCAILTGCVSNPSPPDYAAQSEDTARLRIALRKGTVPHTPAGDGMSAYHHTTEDCQSPTFLDAVYSLDASPADHDSDRRDHRRAGKLGMPLGEYDSLEVAELFVDAGADQEIALQFAVLLAGPFGPFTRCNIALEHAFEAGRDYEIVGQFDALNSCSAVVNELVTGADGASRKQIASLNNRDNPLSEACYVNH